MCWLGVTYWKLGSLKRLNSLNKLKLVFNIYYTYILPSVGKANSIQVWIQTIICIWHRTCLDISMFINIQMFNYVWSKEKTYLLIRKFYHISYVTSQFLVARCGILWFSLPYSLRKIIETHQPSPLISTTV